MSWLSNLFGGGPGGDPALEPAEQDPRERALQLCVGARRAARALPERSEDLRRETGDATRALEQRIEAAIPGEAEAGGRPAPEAEGLLEEAVAALERLHFGLLRVEVYEEDPGELGLTEAVEEVRDVTSRLEAIPAQPGAGARGGGNQEGGASADGAA